MVGELGLAKNFFIDDLHSDELKLKRFWTPGKKPNQPHADLVRNQTEWLDVNKLMTLLPQGAKFQVMFGADVGSHPPVYPDVFHWIDMVYRGAPTAAPAA